MIHRVVNTTSRYRNKTLGYKGIAKNTIISPDFLVWTICGKGQFSHSFGRIARNYAETVPFRKISTPGNQVKLRYFSQCGLIQFQLEKAIQTQSFPFCMFYIQNKYGDSKAIGFSQFKLTHFRPRFTFFTP